MRARSTIAALVSAPLLWGMATAASCASGPDDQPEPVRRFRMGFSGFPPRAEMTAAVASIMTWTTRADAAIFHVEIPWQYLLAGGNAAAHVTREYAGLNDLYRSRGLTRFVTFDFTDGLAREREARELRALGRSIAESPVQAAARAYIREFVHQVQPDWIGLGAETNLVRLAAPRPVYDALRQLAALAAADVRAQRPSATLYTTVQAEVAWGRLQKSNRYEGVEEDFRDFPWIGALGVSSYPYLGGFATPAEMPDDYFARLRGGRTLPLFVAEGGWSSAAVAGSASSPTLQAAYVRRVTELLGQAGATAWLQLNFADLDLSAFPVPAGYEETLSLFTRIGLVDSELRAKPALAAWDSAFARPLVPLRTP